MRERHCAVCGRTGRTAAADGRGTLRRVGERWLCWACVDGAVGSELGRGLAGGGVSAGPRQWWVRVRAWVIRAGEMVELW